MRMHLSPKQHFLGVDSHFLALVALVVDLDSACLGHDRRQLGLDSAYQGVVEHCHGVLVVYLVVLACCQGLDSLRHALDST